MTSGLYCLTIAWNGQKRHIVEQMTESECVAIARRSTYNLRARSPEIRRCIDNKSNTRRKYANLLFNQELVKFDILSESEVTMHNRMARVAEAQLKHQKEIAEYFRNEAGYRICCIAKIAGDNSLDACNDLLHDMEVLSTQQDMLNQASLLDDLLSVLVKKATKYPEYNAKDQSKKYESVLVDFTACIRFALESCNRPNSDTSVADYLNSLHAEQPTLNDTVHSAMLSFAMTRTCFETLNLEILQQLADITNTTLMEYPELLLQTA